MRSVEMHAEGHSKELKSELIRFMRQLGLKKKFLRNEYVGQGIKVTYRFYYVTERLEEGRGRRDLASQMFPLEGDHPMTEVIFSFEDKKYLQEIEKWAKSLHVEHSTFIAA